MGELAALLKPRSVAVVGASADLRKISGRPVKHLVEKGYRGRIYPVNPRVAEVAGIPTVPTVEDLPEGVDLAVVVLPAAQVVETIRALGRRRVGAAIVFASGFGETGKAGRALEAELAAAAREAGVRVLGPNCLGVFNAFERVIATFSQYVDGDVSPGPAAFVSQSGAFGTAIAALARDRGLGFGHFVNTGNEMDITFVDAMAELMADERVRVATGYIEGLKDGPGLCRLAELSMATGKPLVLTKVGRSSEGARAAASHTGSLAGEDRVFDGVLLQTGILRARNEEHMLDLVEVLACCDAPAGNGIGIATQSGGAGVLMVDRAMELGLDVPVLSEATQEKIRGCIPAFGTTQNPVDVTGQFVAEPTVLSESVLHMLDDPEVHVGIVWLQLMTAHVDTLVGIFEEVQRRAQKPFVVVWVAAPHAAVEALRARGIAVLRGAEPAIDAVAGLVAHAEARRRWMAEREVRAARRLPAVALPATEGPVPSVAAAEALAAAGVAVAPMRLARDADGAAEAALALGYPVALKIESPDILHKTEVGGVRLGIADEAALRAAHGALIASVAERRPDARVDGVIVQPMLRGEVEVVIGLQHDPVFGAVVMAGLGGVLVEVLKDVAFAKCPVSPRQALEMIGRLRGAALLDGVRGRPPVGREAFADMLVRVSEFGAAAEGRLRELDLNPVMLTPGGAVAVDVVMVAGAAARHSGRE